MNKFSLPIVFLSLLAASLILAMTNPQVVDVNLYFTQHTLQLGLVLIATLTFGFLLASLMGGWMVLRYRLRLSRLQRQYDLIYQEVRNLRRMPIDEN